ncbi:MAG: FkbM family methyltransferase [Betaproteobacteria bacterium]|nr:FkbM family methyltransferase [Betaproteobacteria bacterium]
MTTNSNCNSSGAEKILQASKRPFSGKIKALEQFKMWRSIKDKVDALYGVTSEIGKYADSQFRYRRLKCFFGGGVVKLLRVKRPNFPRMLNVFGQLVGIDLAQEIQSTEEALVIDGIKFPHPLNEKDKFIFEHELADVVFPSYFKRKSGNFNLAAVESYCAVFKDQPIAFFEGPYEYENVSMAEGDIVFDCGANMGLFSAVASRYGCRVFAFEAIPDIIDNYLSKTANMNGSIEVCNFAVWDKEEMLEFSFLLDNFGGSRCDQLLRKIDFKERRKQFTVPAITLDAFVERNGIRRVDFIKADIEGAERNMLLGARKILKEFAPKLSICTYHLPDDPEVLREIIMEANPKYQIVEKFKKMYAYVP